MITFWNASIICNATLHVSLQIGIKFGYPVFTLNIPPPRKKGNLLQIFYGVQNKRNYPTKMNSKWMLILILENKIDVSHYIFGNICKPTIFLSKNTM